MMGRRLVGRGIEVELVLSSPATRAQQTAEALAEELLYPWDEIVTEESLYEADSEEILAVIEEQDDWVDSVMVVGHNPGLTSLANYLGRIDIENVPTSGVVELRYDVSSWSRIASTAPTDVRFDYPKKTAPGADE
jgi:phosphohistidine phosphatase